MLSGHLRETIMRVYDMRKTTAETVMDIAEMVDSVAKREYSRGRKDQSEKSNQWIPCSERMPEEIGHYLVTIENSSKKRFVSITLKDLRGWVCYENIIAWQSLPPAYKENEEND